MADLRNQQLKDRYQTLVTVSDAGEDPTSGTLQNGRGTPITGLTLDGTLSVSKIIPTGNVTAGNGMYLPAENEIAISSNGVEKFIIKSNGNIRMANNLITGAYITGEEPLSPVHACAPGVAGVALALTVSAFGNGNPGRGTGILIQAPGSGNTVSVAQIDGLQNSSNAIANNAALVFKVANTSGELTERLRITAAGNVNIGSTITAGKFAPTANTTAGNGMYLPTTNQVAIGTNGTEAIRIDSSQRVGVNTTSPTQPFQVTGNSFLNGTLILPANARIFTKSVTLADDTDTTLLTITALGSGISQTSLLIFVSLEGRWGGTARLSGSALYHYTFVKVTGANKATSLQDIKALNFVTENSSLINLTSHSFTNNDVDATTNTISATFTSSGTSTRTFIARVTVLIQGATPAIIT
jgi:hypothetical protein